MPVYHLSTRINSNVSAESILYDLCIYRMDSKGNKNKIVDVQQQPIQPGYETLRHQTADISDPVTTIYIMEVMLYRKTMLQTTPVLVAPFTHMYTLEEFSSGKAWSPTKRENPCYFVTTGVSKLKSQGGAFITVKISQPQRPFIAK